MRTRFRQIAFLIFAFMANVQSWALTMEDGTHHDNSSNSQLVTQQLEIQHHQSNECEEAGGHCCHAINHLLGQVSNGLTFKKFSKEPNLFLFGVVNATSTHPEDIYRPPRFPSLT